MADLHRDPDAGLAFGNERKEIELAKEFHDIREHGAEYDLPEPTPLSEAEIVAALDVSGADAYVQDHAASYAASGWWTREEMARQLIVDRRVAEKLFTDYVTLFVNTDAYELTESGWERRQ